MLKIAHRGASAAAPENTLEAFCKAVELGADAIELDIHACASGEPVVIHDDTVNRTTNGKGVVAEMPWAEIKALSIKGRERVPLLAEVLEAMGPDLIYFIEVKHADAARPAAKLMRRCIEQGWNAENLFMISFQHDVLSAIRAEAPWLQCGATFDGWGKDAVAKAVALGAVALLPRYTEVTRSLMGTVQAAGLKVMPWTVNSMSDIRRISAFGVDGIISNYPDRLSALLP